MNTIALCTVSAFVKPGHETDRNGNKNVFLKPLSGKIPSKAMVMSGTVAINNNIEIGHTYLFAFDEAEVNEIYGRQFNTTKLKEVSAFETMEVVVKLGGATVIDVATADSDPKEQPKDIFANTSAEKF